MTRSRILGGIAAAGALSVGVSGFQTLDRGAVDAAAIEQVRDNLYVITGSSTADRSRFSGGNVGVFVMEEGVAVVDTKLPGWGPVILERIRSVTDKPVVTIVNTHTHGDHVGSNGFFPDTVRIAAHENTEANMRRMDAFQGAGARHLPDAAYSERMSLGAGADRIDLYHFGAGHTDGDTFVVYPALGVLQAGDMFPWRDAPFLDTSNGGSGLALPETLAAAIAGVEGVDVVIPGHVPVTTWESFQEFQRYTADLVDAVRTAKGQGLSADEVAAGIDLSSGYPAYDSTRVDAAVRVIYDELP